MIRARYKIVILIACIAVVGCGKGKVGSQRVRPGTCEDNLRLIVESKWKYMQEYGAKPGEPMWQSQLDLYIEGGFDSLKCPGGGEYSVGKAFKIAAGSEIGAGPEDCAPSCTVHGSAEKLFQKK